MNTTENRILDQPIWRALVAFFLPCFLGLLCQELYSMVDTYIVGKYVGKNAVAAVGNVCVAVQVVIGICSGISNGAGVVIAQHFGAKKMDRVKADIRCSLLIAIVGGLALTVVSTALAGRMVHWLQTPEEIAVDSTTYLRIYFFALVPNLIYNFGTAILRGMGDSKRPLYILMAASFLNIALDYIFVVKCHWDVLGVAMATDLSQILSAVLVLWLLVRQIPDLLKPGKRAGGTYGSIFRIGLPTAVQSVMYSSSNVLIQTAINSFNSTAIIAAWSVYGKVDSICWIMMSSMGTAVTAFAGQNFGAGRYDRVKRAAWVGSAIVGGVLMVLVAGCYVLARPIFSLFTKGDLEVVEVGTAMLRFLAPAYMLYFLIEILPGVLRGCGDVMIPTIASMIGICLIRVLWLIFVVPVYHTLNMVMMSYVITWALTSGFYLVYFLRGNWLRRCIARTK